MINKQMIIAIEVAPNRYPRLVYIEPSKKVFYAMINNGADVEGVPVKQQLDNNIYAIFHGFRCLSGLEANRRLGKDIIAGTFYVVATDGQGNLCSLTADKIKTYMFRFWDIEEISDAEMIEANIDLLFSDDYKAKKLSPS